MCNQMLQWNGIWFLRAQLPYEKWSPPVSLWVLCCCQATPLPPWASGPWLWERLPLSSCVPSCLLNVLWWLRSPHMWDQNLYPDLCYPRNVYFWAFFPQEPKVLLCMSWMLYNLYADSIYEHITHANWVSSLEVLCFFLASCQIWQASWHPVRPFYSSWHKTRVWPLSSWESQNTKAGKTCGVALSSPLTTLALSWGLN